MTLPELREEMNECHEGSSNGAPRYGVTTAAPADCATLIHAGRVLPAVHAMTEPGAETRCGLRGTVTGTDARRLAEGEADTIQLQGARVGSDEWRQRAGWLGPDRLTENRYLSNCPDCRAKETA